MKFSLDARSGREEREMRNRLFVFLFTALAAFAIAFPALAQRGGRTSNRSSRSSRPSVSRRAPRSSHRSYVVVRPYYSSYRYYGGYGYYGHYDGWYYGRGHFHRDERSDLVKINFGLKLVDESEREAVKLAPVFIDDNQIGSVEKHSKIESGEYQLKVVFKKRVFETTISPLPREKLNINLEFNQP